LGSEISDTEPLGSEITDTEPLGSEISDTEPSSATRLFVSLRQRRKVVPSLVQKFRSALSSVYASYPLTVDNNILL
jgi:hypothetical protein